MSNNEQKLLGKNNFILELGTFELLFVSQLTMAGLSCDIKWFLQNQNCYKAVCIMQMVYSQLATISAMAALFPVCSRWLLRETMASTSMWSNVTVTQVNCFNLWINCFVCHLLSPHLCLISLVFLFLLQCWRYYFQRSLG